MRSDMAKVVTEAPRRRHGNPSKKFGWRLRKDEHELEDHGPDRASTARPASTAGARRTLPMCSGRCADICASRLGGPGIKYGMHVWEHRECGWFIHMYRRAPQRLVRVLTRSDGRDVPIYRPPHRQRVATKQASKKEIRDGRPLLQRDPLTPAAKRLVGRGRQEDRC
jgi:hypothetical protein